MVGIFQECLTVPLEDGYLKLTYDEYSHNVEYSFGVSRGYVTKIIRHVMRSNDPLVFVMNSGNYFSFMPLSEAEKKGEALSVRNRHVGNLWQVFVSGPEYRYYRIYAPETPALVELMNSALANPIVKKNKFVWEERNY